MVLSEYGITEVNRVIYPNRIFRHQGWLNIKDEFGLDTLDSGGSSAFALTDHQVAHIYLQEKSPDFSAKVKAAIESLDGVATVLEGTQENKPDWIIREREILLPWLKRMPGSHIISGKRIKKPRNLPAVLIYTESMVMIRLNYLWIPRFHFQTSKQSVNLSPKNWASESTWI